MPTFGDAVLVPFPFTDQSGSKTRPAVVVSSQEFNRRRRDVIIMAVTSRISPRLSFSETLVRDWRDAGLLKPSLMKPVVATIEQRLILSTLGSLSDQDRDSLEKVLKRLIGQSAADSAARHSPPSH